MPALRKIKTTDLYYTVHTDTGMHYIKPKNPSFPSAFSFLLQNIPLSSSVFSQSHLSKAKETETEIQRGEVAPYVLQSLRCWKAEFHLKMFGIAVRWIKLPLPDRLGCDIFGRAAINKYTRHRISKCWMLKQMCIHKYEQAPDFSVNNLWRWVQVK